MGGKYTEQSVVLLKREITQLSGEVHDLIVEKKKVKDEVLEVEKELADKRQALRDFGNIVANYLTSLRNDESRLISSIETLKKEGASHASILAVLKSGVLSIEVPQPDFSFANQIAAVLEERLAYLKSSTDDASREKDALVQVLEHKRSELKEITKETSILEKCREQLRIDIEAGNDKNGKLGQEYLKLETKISNLRTREKNVLLMEERLDQKARTI